MRCVGQQYIEMLLLMMMMVVVVVVVVTLLICDHPGALGACTVHSIFLVLSRAPLNRGLPSIVGADNARWHTPRPIVRARWILTPPLSGGGSDIDSRSSGCARLGGGFSSCGLRDLKVASRTSTTALLALQVSAEQSVAG